MIADDEPKIRQGLKSVLEEMKLPITVCAEARNGMEALEKIEQFQPDFILMDICMPKLSGIQFLEELRKLDKNCPVIVISGFNEFSYAKQAIKLGVSEYLLKPIAEEELREELYFDIEFQQYMQFKFYEQWMKLKSYANSKGIQIIGDIPIYVAMDSADAWAHPELFQLDEENVPLAVAGCPPDGFSATGQLWGNPLYRWDYHRNTGYQWWISRMSYCFRLYDVVRIDHFRGFDEYFSIPYGDKDARGGHWEKGPGIDLFRKIEQALGWKQVIAEDLGYMTDSVRHLVYESGFPGMKVLEFAFDSRDSGCASDYLPHNYPENCVAYTGTHDNETIVGWWKSITPAERKLARDYLCDYATPEEELYKSFISLIMRSSARVCVIPMQDYMGLDNRFRMNKPSTVGINWMWRIKKRDLTKKLQKEIHDVTLRYGRKNWD